MSAVVSGLDIRKEYTYATTLGPDGEVIAQGRMPNEEVYTFLRHYQVERAAMEATTSIAPIYRKLVEEGYDVLISHLKKNRYITEARIKTDLVDSKVLAEPLRMNSLPESYVLPPNIAELKEKVRSSAFLVRKQTKLKVKIQSVLTYEGVKPPKGYGGTRAEGKNGFGASAWSPWTVISGSWSLKEKIRVLSRELRRIAVDDEDIELLTTIPGVGY